MITIENVTPKGKLWGRDEYVIKINNKVITDFSHDRQLGLAECLRNAATAVEIEQWANNLGKDKNDQIRILS